MKLLKNNFEIERIMNQKKDIFYLTEEFAKHCWLWFVTLYLSV